MTDRQTEHHQCAHLALYRDHNIQQPPAPKSLQSTIQQSETPKKKCLQIIPVPVQDAQTNEILLHSLHVLILQDLNGDNSPLQTNSFKNVLHLKDAQSVSGQFVNGWTELQTESFMNAEINLLEGGGRGRNPFTQSSD